MKPSPETLLLLFPFIVALGYAREIQRRSEANPVSKLRLKFILISGVLAVSGLFIQISSERGHGAWRSFAEISQTVFLLYAPYKLGMWMVWQDRRKRAAASAEAS
ncbi:MAG: hypothetical protein K0Q55_605 [Verrucomicrobia bacterium]|nr:hypothetical protein [Verrucomicrobiota bacterium]